MSPEAQWSRLCPLEVWPLRLAVEGTESRHIWFIRLAIGWWIGVHVSLTVTSRDSVGNELGLPSSPGLNRRALLAEARSRAELHPATGLSFPLLLTLWPKEVGPLTNWTSHSPSSQRKIVRDGRRALQVCIPYYPILGESRFLPCHEWMERGAVTSPVADSEDGRGTQNRLRKIKLTVHHHTHQWLVESERKPQNLSPRGNRLHSLWCSLCHQGSQECHTFILTGPRDQLSLICIYCLGI